MVEQIIYVLEYSNRRRFAAVFGNYLPWAAKGPTMSHLATNRYASGPDAIGALLPSQCPKEANVSSTENNRLSDVTVSVRDLIETVGDNRDSHGAVYEEALAGFRLAANRVLNDRIDEIANREVVSLRFVLPIPEDHTKDYDRVLVMLKMTLDAGCETIILDQREQEMYVMDEWAWKTTFSDTSTFYSVSGG